MGLLDDLIGGGERRAQYQDFVDRYQRGNPTEGYTDDEALERYREVAPELSRDDYRTSAEEAFAKLSPDERAEFARWMRTRARERGLDTTDLDRDGFEDRARDPRELAEATTRMRDRDPSIVEQLLGRGGTGGPFDNPIAKAAVAGIAAVAAQRLMGGRR